MMNFEIQSMRYKNNVFSILDQTMLPREEVWVEVKNIEQMYHIIKDLKVRGASLIGLSAAVFMAKYALENKPDVVEFIHQAKYLESSRPTAVHLSLMLQSISEVYSKTHNPEKVVEEVMRFYDEDASACIRMAKFGNTLVKPKTRILTHCNTGSLIGPGFGSAIGVIHEAHITGKDIFVYVDETRPLLQGARLTAWEMNKFNIPFSLICDNMGAYVMAQGLVDFVIAGADRIAANGDTANKIGTYSLAVLANYHKIPFYIAAPHTTFDLNTKTGKEIIVENRASNEVSSIITGYGTLQVAYNNCPAFNPAFDVTPRNLISAFITNCGIIYPEDSIQDKLANFV